MSSIWSKARVLLLATAVTAAVAAAGPAAGPAARASGSSVISGTVFRDLNRNGVQDAGEPGFSNAVIALYESSGTAVTTAYTDSSGHYRFGGLADGSYWPSLENSWVMTSHPAPAPGYLDPRVAVSLSGTATANIALRPVVRSSIPLSTVTTAGGTIINSFDDVVAASRRCQRAGRQHALRCRAAADHHRLRRRVHLYLHQRLGGAGLVL
jgi:hypothetical protein